MKSTPALYNAALAQHPLRFRATALRPPCVQQCVYQSECRSRYRSFRFADTVGGRRGLRYTRNPAAADQGTTWTFFRTLGRSAGSRRNVRRCCQRRPLQARRLSPGVQWKFRRRLALKPILANLPGTLAACEGNHLPFSSSLLYHA